MKKYGTLKEEAKPRAKAFFSCGIVNLVLGILVLVFNIALFPIVFRKIVEGQVALTNGTMSFEQWLSPTPKIYKMITVYNLTNTADIENGSNPIVNAIGPYYFREYRQKINVDEVYDDVLKFNERKWYEFDINATIAHNPNNSHLNPATDKFTTINVAYVGAVYNATTSNIPKKEKEAIMALAIAFKENTLFMTRTVNEVLFGYTDKLLQALSIAKPEIPSRVQVVYNMSEVDIERTSIVNTGRKNVSLLGQYSEWEGHSSLPWWGSAEAGKVNGTEGLFFAPNLDKTKTVTTFTDDLYRASPMEFVNETEMMGVHCYKYHIPAYGLMNASSNPLNAGFFSYGPTGTMNLTAPTFAPIMVSKPSYLDGEPYLYEDVVGLKTPNRSMDTYICVEPITGCLVKALKQLQVNVMLQRTEEFPGFHTLRDKPRLVPMALILEGGGMDEDLVTKFKNKVFKPRDTFIIVIWLAFGALLLLVALFTTLFVTHVLRNQDTEGKRPLIPNDTDKNIYTT